MTALSDDEAAMLELEAGWWKHNGAKESHIRETFGISPTVYYNRLNQLLDRPEAMEVAPMVVRRLQRVREARRSARRWGTAYPLAPLSTGLDGHR